MPKSTIEKTVQQILADRGNLHGTIRIQNTDSKILCNCFYEYDEIVMNKIPEVLLTRKLEDMTIEGHHGHNSYTLIIA